MRFEINTFLQSFFDPLPRGGALDSAAAGVCLSAMQSLLNTPLPLRAAFQEGSKTGCNAFIPHLKSPISNLKSAA